MPFKLKHVFRFPKKVVREFERVIQKGLDVGNDAVEKTGIDKVLPKGVSVGVNAISGSRGGVSVCVQPSPNAPSVGLGINNSGNVALFSNGQSVREFTGSPPEVDFSTEQIDYITAVREGIEDTRDGIVHAVVHPIETANGLVEALKHPVDTATRVIEDYRDSDGPGKTRKIVGTVTGVVLGGGPLLRFMPKKKPKSLIQLAEEHGFVAQSSEVVASSVNSAAAQSQKMRALEGAKITADKVENRGDVVKYYKKRTPSNKPGATSGASYVTEHNVKTNDVRTYIECYDSHGNVNRVHPKSLNGQDVTSDHFPITQKEKLRLK